MGLGLLLTIAGCGEPDPSPGSDEAADRCDLLVPCTGTENGCLEETVRVGHWSRDDLSPWVDSNVILENGYTVYWLTYHSDGRLARATVTVPDVEPPADFTEGFGVVINLPGTVGLGDDCAVGQTAVGSGLAGTFGARGLVGAAVDYPGLGTPGGHPYLIREVEGRAGLDAMRAVRRFACDTGVRISGAFAAVGLSQGGHAALAVASEAASYAPEVDLRAVGAAAPASGFVEHWAPGIELAGSHLVYHGLITRAWKTEFGSEQTESPWATGFDPSIFESQCLFSTPSLFSSVSTVPAQTFTDAYRGAFLGEFSAAGEYDFMATGFAASRLGPYEQTAPVLILQGSADSTVLQSFTDELVAELRAGSVELEYEVVSGGGHTDVAFGYLSERQLRTEESLEWLREHLLP